MKSAHEAPKEPLVYYFGATKRQAPPVVCNDGATSGSLAMEIQLASERSGAGWMGAHERASKARPNSTIMHSNHDFLPNFICQQLAAE